MTAATSASEDGAISDESAISDDKAIALVALGSNLGSPQWWLRRAAADLEIVGTVAARSRLYFSLPVGGPAGQRPYLNAVVALRPHAHVREPLGLLKQLLTIERRHGRVRGRLALSPRTVDLDLLAVGDAVQHGPALTLPHPRMMDRVFVLAPLLEVAPGWRHPATGILARQALARLGRAGVRPTRLSW